jgi:hypothetical protein
MISEIEARACQYTLRRPVHPYKWGRIVGPLMVAAAFSMLIIGGGLVTHRAATTPTQQAESGSSDLELAAWAEPMRNPSLHDD